MAGSRLVHYFPISNVVTVSTLVAGFGFLLFWQAGGVLLALCGLFISGLGIASLYPLILSLAIGAAGNNTVQASARATLASGLAILTLPLLLGRLADAVGIGLAYGVLVFLLVGVLLIVQLGRKNFPA